jgi:iron complex outermembrane receptor protein
MYVNGAMVLLLIATGLPAAALAQATASLTVRVMHQDAPMSGATVAIGAATGITDERGDVVIAAAEGMHRLLVQKEGFVPAMLEVEVKGGQNRTVSIALSAAPDVHEVVTVLATRTGARLDDSPTRVEVLGREEIEEKMLMTPGDIVMMLNEMGGMRVQATSPGLGAATVRVQGMRGRYTRFFSDGLPLFGEVGGIGLLQIPPMDLGQVEVIKGVASSMYGAGAMGGVVNLVSRQPGDERERELLVNRSTRGGTDVVAWFASPDQPGWSYTLLAGGHWQSPTDVDGDRWADLAEYSRAVLRPRLFWKDDRGASFFATVGFTGEDRTGGTTDGALPSGLTHVEALDTRRIDGGFVAQRLWGGSWLASARAAVSHQRHDHRFGDRRERDRHRTAFAEIALRRMLGPHTVVAGVALEHDAYRGVDLPQFDFAFWVPGVFGQADLELAPWLSISGSARLDRHSEYDTFVSPRASALLRSGGWTSRLSAGTGFFASSPLTEETQGAGLSRLVIPVSLRPEKGRSVALDLTRIAGPVSGTVTLFRSRVEDPLHVDRSAGLALTNLPAPTTNTGLELLGTFRHAPFAVTASYAYVRAREVVGGIAQDVALTPRHSAGLIAMWEREDAGRIGVEWYVTGEQRLEENPYRDRSRSYHIVGLLAERRLGRLRLFVNGENLTGTRQTRWDPLLRPSRAPDGRWTVDAWAPLDGRTINGGVRLAF